MTRSEVRLSLCFFAVVGLVLDGFASRLIAQEEPGIDVTLDFREGRLREYRLLTPTLTIETEYGNLTVPTNEIYVVYQALRTDGDSVQDIEKHIDDLGDDVSETRDTAQAELIKIGAPAIPAVEDALDSPDAEVAERAAEILEMIRQASTVTPMTDDVIITSRFAIIGRITTDKYEFAPPRFVPETINIPLKEIAKLAIRPLNVQTVTLPAQLSTGDEMEATYWRSALQAETGSYSDVFTCAMVLSIQ